MAYIHCVQLECINVHLGVNSVTWRVSVSAIQCIMVGRVKRGFVSFGGVTGVKGKLVFILS